MSWSSDTSHTSSWGESASHSLVPDIKEVTLTYTWPNNNAKLIGVPLTLPSMSREDVFDPVIFQTLIGNGETAGSNGSEYSGSLVTINANMGYHVKPFASNSFPLTLTLTGIPDHTSPVPDFNDPIIQRISFPGIGLTDAQADINIAFPLSSHGFFDTIVSDSAAAYWTGSEWAGSLDKLDPTTGYWLGIDDSCPEDFSFQWNIPATAVPNVGWESENHVPGSLSEETKFDSQYWSGELKHGSTGFSDGDTTVASAWSAEVGSPLDGWTTLAPFNENFVEQEIYTNSFGSESPHTAGFEHDPYARIRIAIDGFFHTYSHPLEINNYFHTSEFDFTAEDNEWTWVTTG